MERYESKQVQIRRPAAFVYELLADFTHLTPVVEGKADDWQATEDRCSFKVKGIPLALRMVERQPGKLIKVTGEEGGPMDFTLWIQLAEAAEADTRMRIVLDVELNMMMKMMVGSKLAGAVDQIAEQIAQGFNSMPG